MGLADIYALDLSIVPVLADMEETGVRVDKGRLLAVQEMLAQQLVGIEQWLWREYKWAGNLRSTKDKQQLLFDVGGLRPGRKTQTGFSTDKEVLSGLDSELAAKVLLWNELDVLRSNFVEKLPKMVLADGRIHANFNQAGGHEDSGDDRNSPSTGRLSSSNPNLQNIPVRTELGKLVRAAFLPQPEWVFIKTDVAQEEVRLLALLAGCKRLIEQFEAGRDPYIPMTAQLFPGVDITKDRRFTAKTVFLAKQYGAGAAKVWEICGKLKMPITRAHAGRVNDWFDTQYPEISLYVDKCWQKVLELGYVESYFGRRRWLPAAIVGDRRQREAAKRMAVNMPVQGTGADVMKMVLVKVYGELPPPARLVLTVHDEWVVETPINLVRDVWTICSRATKGLLPIPLPVEVGQPAECWE